eukprot:gene4033-4380_t
MPGEAAAARVKKVEGTPAGSPGTPAFLSPEVMLCMSQEALDECNPYKIDAWAVGVTIYCMLFGKLPFHGHTQVELSRSICEDPVKWTDGVQVSDVAKDLVEHLLAKKPAERITVKEMNNHPFLLGATESFQKEAPQTINEPSESECMSSIDYGRGISLLKATVSMA